MDTSQKKTSLSDTTEAMILAACIEHTLLRADASYQDIAILCDEARTHGFFGVCVNTSHLRRCVDLLGGTEIKRIAVVGFPLGAQTGVAKAFEAREAVALGADEVDMVINVGALKSKDYALVVDDIRGVVAAATSRPVKVILETGVLSHELKLVGSSLAKAAGAAYVKTCTGFGPGVATVEDIVLLRGVVGDAMGVKASGGIRTAADARKLLAAGANRIGTSASVAIITGAS